MYKLKKIWRPEKKSLIVPSTKLLCVNVHKIQDFQACKRYYFWRWILNLVSRKPNLNFWFGELSHLAHELIADGKTEKQIRLTLDKRSKKILKNFVIDPYMVEEIALQLEICKTLMSCYLAMFGGKLQDFKAQGTEVSFGLELGLSGLVLYGTWDAHGILKGKLTLKEIKTASRLTNEYFQRLKFDKQINTYALGVKSHVGRLPSKCNYLVIRKPTIKVKQKESVSQYLIRLENDIWEVRPEYYYITDNFSFGKHRVAATENDVEQESFDMMTKIDSLDDIDILDPLSWARNDRQCFTYGTCLYFPLCANCHKWKLYLGMYQMRDIRYELEVEELNESRTMDTSKRGVLS